MRTKLCQPHRGRLVGEMEELSGAIAQISRVAVQVEALEREIKRQNPILGKTLGYLPPSWPLRRRSCGNSSAMLRSSIVLSRLQ